MKIQLKTKKNQLDFIWKYFTYWAERLILQLSRGMFNSFRVQPKVDTCPILKNNKILLKCKFMCQL